MTANVFSPKLSTVLTTFTYYTFQHAMLSLFKLRTSENNTTILPPTPIPHSKFPDSFIGAMIPPIFQVISDLCNSRSINFRFSREVIKTLWLTGKSIDYSVGHLHPRKPHVLEYSTNIIGIPPEPKRLHLSGSE